MCLKMVMYNIIESYRAAVIIWQKVQELNLKFRLTITMSRNTNLEFDAKMQICDI